MGEPSREAARDLWFGTSSIGLLRSYSRVVVVVLVVVVLVCYENMGAVYGSILLVGMSREHTSGSSEYRGVAEQASRGSDL